MIDLKKVFPRLKELYNAEETLTINEQDEKTITLSEPDSPILKPFAQDLAISYALDMGTHYQFIPNSDLSEKLTIEILHQAALENMINEIGNNIQAHGEPSDVLMITNGGNYEAAMLIWEEIWPQLESVVGGEVYAAIPARDILYIAPQSNPDAIERLSGLIKKMFEEIDNVQGLMVRHIYQRGTNGWEIVTTA